MSEKTTRLSIRTPTDLVATVPYLLGFHPSDSIVLVWLDGTRVLLASWLDVGSTTHPHLPETLAQLAAGMHPTGVVVLGYSADELSAMVALTRMEAMLGPVVQDVVMVDGRSWRSLWCSEEDCCRGTWHTWDATWDHAALKAETAGLCTAPSLGHLAQRVAGPDDAHLAGRVDEFSACQRQWDLDVDSRVAEAALRWAEALDTGSVDSDTAVLLAVAVSTSVGRDACLGSLSASTAAAHVELLLRCVEVAPVPWASPVLCVLALAAWLAGQGGLVSVCLARAEGLPEVHQLAGLVRQVQQRALPPELWGDGWQAEDS